MDLHSVPVSGSQKSHECNQNHQNPHGCSTFPTWRQNLRSDVALRSFRALKLYHSTGCADVHCHLDKAPGLKITWPRHTLKLPLDAIGCCHPGHPLKNRQPLRTARLFRPIQIDSVWIFYPFSTRSICHSWFVAWHAHCRDMHLATRFHESLHLVSFKKGNNDVRIIEYHRDKTIDDKACQYMSMQIT